MDLRPFWLPASAGFITTFTAFQVKYLFWRGRNVDPFEARQLSEPEDQERRRRAFGRRTLWQFWDLDLPGYIALNANLVCTIKITIFQKYSEKDSVAATIYNLSLIHDVGQRWNGIAKLVSRQVQWVTIRKKERCETTMWSNVAKICKNMQKHRSTFSSFFNMSE